MSSRLIGIVGFARTGKDTVGDYLVSHHGFTRLASADLLRDVLYGANPLVPLESDHVRLQWLVDAIGWEEAKVRHPEVRRLLQDLGTEGVRRVLGADTWINETLKRAAAIAGPVVITDTRFPNEAQLTNAAGGQVWRIDRPGVGALNERACETHRPTAAVGCSDCTLAHASERFIMDIKVDHVVDNDDTIETLYCRVDAILAFGDERPDDPWPGSTQLGRHYTGGPAGVGL